MRRSSDTHTVKNIIALVGNSIRGVHALTSLTTDFTRDPLMERAMSKSFGVSAIGVMAF